jgi:hypothetical protein
MGLPARQLCSFNGAALKEAKERPITQQALPVLAGEAAGFVSKDCIQHLSQD